MFFFRCPNISALQSWTAQVLYCKPSTETWVFSPTAWIYLSAQPPIQSKRCRTIQKKASGGFYASCISCRSLLISRQVCESVCEAKISEHKVPDGWTSSVASSVCCLQLQLPLEDSIHPLVLLRNCISEQVRSRASDAACDHSPWLRVLLGLALVQLSTHTPTTNLHPLTPYRGSALCQPWSGTYYRSCRNDGF